MCIPVFNGAQYLRATLKSVLDQNYPNFEIIIIDDQSTDGSGNIICEYADQDSRIVFLRNEKRKGLVENWNECIKTANGE